jgi:hypothetical protein
VHPEHPFTIPIYTFSIPVWCYLLQCVLGTLVLRIIFFTFRAWAVQRGDFPDSEKEIEWKDWSFGRAFGECFKGFSALIGFAELAAYPVFIKLGYLTAIAGWLAVKTAGAWGGWKVSRTSFNRFLLNNILELAIAFLWLTRYVQQG